MARKIEIGSLLIPRDPNNSMGSHTAVVLSHKPMRACAIDLYEVMVTFADPAQERVWGRIHKWRTSSIMKMYEVIDGSPGT